jgi:hypothetical protein
MQSYDIPDPFQEFVKQKYLRSTGHQYDFFAKEWHIKCGCCKEDLYAPTKKTMIKTRLYHTRNLCLGGY